MSARLAWLPGLLLAAGAQAADLGAPAPEVGVPSAEVRAVRPVAAAPEVHQVLVLLELPPPHFRPDGHDAGGYGDAAGRTSRHRTAAALARANGLGLVTDWPLPLLGLDCYVMEVPASRPVADVAEQLARDGRVAWAQPMNSFRPLSHDDPLLGAQPVAREWKLEAMHAAATGRDVRVAIVDSGVQRDHPDLAGQIVAHADFAGDRSEPAERHGTAVAGIVAARADDHVGIAGVAPRARLLALRACREVSPTDTTCTTLGLALALHAAIDQRAQVINLSLGGPPDRLIERLLEAALGRGIGVVAAADRAQPKGGFPAAVPGVVAVVDETSGAAPGGMAAAPGTDVLTTLPGSRWDTVSGASYAAAHVSGLLALMLEARGQASATARPVGADLVLEADGRVDSCASLGRAGSACACACPPAARMAAAEPRR
jgi:subtilisin family serine protease